MCPAITFSLTAFARHSRNLVTEPERGLRSCPHGSAEGRSAPPENYSVNLECVDKPRDQREMNRRRRYAPPPCVNVGRNSAEFGGGGGGAAGNAMQE